MCGLALTLYVQSGTKYVLTQGDGLLIARLSTLGEQGAYALASNYGGLIARMLFQPIEESSRNLFAKLCSSSPEPKNDAHKDDISRAKSIVKDILRFYSILAAVAWVVGPTLAPLLLELLVGSKWSDTSAGEVLATYCYYIPLLAVNGVTEAFVAAVASSAELQCQSLYMAAYFVGFASAAYLFLGVLKAGAQGLVYANCVNMILRIIFNWRFIKAFFKKHGQVIYCCCRFASCLLIWAAFRSQGNLTNKPYLFRRQCCTANTETRLVGRRQDSHCAPPRPRRYSWDVRTGVDILGKEVSLTLLRALRKSWCVDQHNKIICTANINPPFSGWTGLSAHWWNLAPCTNIKWLP